MEVNQDVDCFASEIEFGCIEGGVSLNGKKLQKYDACEITGNGMITIDAINTENTEHGDVAHILMFTMKEVPGSS